MAETRALPGLHDAPPSRTRVRSTTDPDEAAVRTVIESVAALADLSDFAALEQLYHDEIQVDYTSLNGGQPEVISAADLMARWAAFLPGFARTRHVVRNLDVTIAGQTAEARCDVVADHWTDDRHWQVSGRYQYDLERRGRDWRIVRHKLIVTGESGSREIFAAATAAAEKSPNAYLLRRRGRELILQFLAGLQDKRMDRVNAVWTHDAVQEMPYAPESFPRRVVGKDALIRHYASWPQNSGKARFIDGIVFHDTQDPKVIIAEFHGVVDIVPTQRTYDQRYIGLFRFENDRIALFREYFDPIVFSQAFGLSEGSDFYGKS